jgi:hypothetical protein
MNKNVLIRSCEILQAFFYSSDSKMKILRNGCIYPEMAEKAEGPRYSATM